MRIFFAALLFLLLPTPSVIAQPKASKKGREFIAIRVYHATDSLQLTGIDQYFQSSLMPALQKSGFTQPGVFKALDNDTAADKRFYFIVSLSSLSQLELLNGAIGRSLADSASSPLYTKAVYNLPPFSRIETIVLQAFEGSPQLKLSGVIGKAADRVYELRSYESATEGLHANKVRMFNSGEIDLFQRLGFNAVFYGQVLAGSRMPNLMYMTSFANKAARDEHWKAFGSDPEWKAMSAKPEYQHNVSKITITFLQPTTYSKL